MPTLHTALTDPAAAGLYRLGSRATAATVRRTSEATGRLFLPIDGTNVSSKRDFLLACAEALQAPAYIGRNWDALEEALRDLSWLAPLTSANHRGYVVLLDPAAPFIRRAPAEWATARAVLQSAINHWRDTPTPLTVLLRRTDRLAHDLPRIEA